MGSWEGLWRTVCTSSLRSWQKIKHLAVPGQSSIIPQDIHNNSCAKNICRIMPRLLFPIALTPGIMKCFGRMVVKQTSVKAENYCQYSYRLKCTAPTLADAMVALTHQVHLHLNNSECQEQHHILWCTGSPHSCVLSPVLFTIMTNDCKVHYNHTLWASF